MVFVFMSVQEVIKAMEFLDYEGLKLYDENIKKFISTIDIPDPINPDDFQSKIKGTGIAFVINDQAYTSPEFTYGENGFQAPHVRLPYEVENLIELFDPELGSVPIITSKSSEFHFHGEADSVPYTGLTGCNAAGKILVSTGSSWELQSLGNVALDPNAYLPLSGGKMHGTIDFMDNGGDQNLLTLEEVCPLFSINRDTSTLSINGIGTFNTVKIGSSIYASQFMINDYCGMYHNGDKLIIDSYDNVEITAQSLFVNNISSNGFFVLKPDESSYGNNYVILAGGGVKPLSEITPDLTGYLELAGGTMTGNILPSASKPPIGTQSANIPGQPSPTYISLGSGEKYFDKVYAREFKGLADNALKLYADSGNAFSIGPTPINVGGSSTPVYFSNGVPVACNSIPTSSTIAGWGYVTTSGITQLNVGTGLQGKANNGDSTNAITTSVGTIALKTASDSEIGGIKIGYQGSDKNYPVQLNNNNQAFVYVPWTDTQQSLDGYLTTAVAEATYVKKIGDIMTGPLQATGFYETSDVRKKEIKSGISLDKCYDLIDKCQTVIYSLKDQTTEQVGMIAQEIEEFFPEVVATDEEGFKSLAYDRLVVICFKVLKDVIKRLEKLEHE